MLFVRLRGTEWAPSPDFDGIVDQRPSVLGSRALSARFDDRTWKPRDALDAATTLEALAATAVTAVTGEEVADAERARDLIRQCATALGRPESRAWALALAAMCGPDLPRPITRAVARELHPSTFDARKRSHLLSPEGDRARVRA